MKRPPTFGAVQSGNSSFVYDPPANPDESTTAAAANGRAFNFNLPNAGNAYIRFFTADEGTSCNPVSNSQAGLYLDGAPIAHTERAIGTSVSPSTHDYVAIVQAAAGPHTAAVREDCPNGSLSSNVQSADPDWTVLLLGG
jgi:hypothetical protein